MLTNKTGSDNRRFIITLLLKSHCILAYWKAACYYSLRALSINSNPTFKTIPKHGLRKQSTTWSNFGGSWRSCQVVERCSDFNKTGPQQLIHNGGTTTVYVTPNRSNRYSRREPRGPHAPNTRQSIPASSIFESPALHCGGSRERTMDAASVGNGVSGIG